MELRDRTFLILHGWGGSGPEHWQSWLAERLRGLGAEVRFPCLPEPDHPRRDAWLAVLRAALAGMAGERVVICHSLAVLLWLHYAASAEGGHADRLLLVAPPGPSANNPQIESFFPAPVDAPALKCSARDILLVCSAADPFCPEGAAVRYGEPLGIPVKLLPAPAGHINGAAGFGPWPWVEQWCLDL